MADANAQATAPLGDAQLATELLARAKADQQARRAADGAPADAEASCRIDEVDRDNTAWMRAVLSRHGWPGRRLVGEAGADAAWLLCQHADRVPDHQRHALVLLERAVAEGDAPPRHLAYLTDRVLVAQGRPQRYGTQFHLVDGIPSPRPIEEPEALDRRRAEMGLEPFAEYARRFASLTDASVSQPE